jgi:hypothetical protein
VERLEESKRWKLWDSRRAQGQVNETIFTNMRPVRSGRGEGQPDIHNMDKNNSTPTCTMRKRAAMGAKSKKGGLPVSSSTIVHPRLQMSHADVGPDAEQGRRRGQEGPAKAE